MARVLVTGSKGFIGQHLVRELTYRGHEVFGLDLMHAEDEWRLSGQQDLISPHYLRGDISDYYQLVRALAIAQPAVVFHAAAEFGRDNGADFSRQLWTTNVLGTRYLLDLQQRDRFRLIHCSSSEVYGDYPDLMREAVLDEQVIVPLNDYAMTKRVNEWQIANSRMQYGTETVIVRCFNIYGPGERYSPYRSFNCRFLYCALHGLPLAVHRGHTRCCLYVSDAVRTFAAIIEHFQPGAIYNIGSEMVYTVEDIAEVAVKVCGADPAVIRFLTQEPMTTRFKQPDIRRAVDVLGHHETVTLEHGMSRTAVWLAEHDNVERSL